MKQEGGSDTNVAVALGTIKISRKWKWKYWLCIEELRLSRPHKF